MTRVTARQIAPEATAPRPAAGTSEGTRSSPRVAAIIPRIARLDRRILKALAAFDRGERPAA